jgi:hypothetical protein
LTSSGKYRFKKLAKAGSRFASEFRQRLFSRGSGKVLELAHEEREGGGQRRTVISFHDDAFSAKWAMVLLRPLHDDQAPNAEEMLAA